MRVVAIEFYFYTNDLCRIFLNLCNTSSSVKMITTYQQQPGLSFCWWSHGGMATIVVGMFEPLDMGAW